MVAQKGLLILLQTLLISATRLKFVSMMINKLENKNGSIVIKIFIAVLFIVILATDTFALTIEEPRGTGAMVDGEVIINTPKGGDLNVRRGPSTKYKIVAKAKNGTKYYFSGISGSDDDNDHSTWYLLANRRGLLGWVREDFCKVIKRTDHRAIPLPPNSDETIDNGTTDDDYGGCTDVEVIERAYKENPFTAKKEWVGQEIYIASLVLGMKEIDDFYVLVLADSEQSSAAYICAFPKKQDNQKLFDIKNKRGVVIKGTIRDIHEENEATFPYRTCVYVVIANSEIVKIIK